MKPLVIAVSADASAGRTFDRCREPVTVGVALPRGAASAGDGWVLTDAHGHESPVQWRILDRWSDGSVAWLLVDFQADVRAGETATYQLTKDGGVSGLARTLEVEAHSRGFVVRTGSAIFNVFRDESFFLERTGLGGAKGSPVRSRVIVEDLGGAKHSLVVDELSVETIGPVRTTIRLNGRIPSANNGVCLDVTARLHFFAHLSSVRFETAVSNPQAAKHRDGYWDLGDPGSILLHDLSIETQVADRVDSLACSAEPGYPFETVPAPLELFQESSGGPNWRSVNHCNQFGQVVAHQRGYRLVAGSTQREGHRATPIVSSPCGESSVTVAVPAFWQNHPIAIEADERGITLRTLPRQAAGGHELQGGERKTYTFFVCYGTDTVSEEPLAWCRAPLLAVATPQSSRAASVWSPITIGTAEARDGYRTLVNSAVEGPESFDRKREVIDEYGWRHFGELYADHEAVRQPGLVSHYNNQYDAIAGFAIRFCETGDRRWWNLMNELAAHVADIDVYHCTQDKAAYNRGLFWHTLHYVPAHTATHRSYSRQTQLPGGGPSAEHNYTTGLMLHFFLTGSESSRQTVLDLAEWVLAMDDGAQARFSWLDSGPTGFATATSSQDYHGPGRGGGNSINALLDAHRLTGDSRYLQKADELVARCIHPDDQPDARNLLDAETRWSYTVFLQVLGKYLNYRRERDLDDARYDYARAALLRYAEWMANHERPYLDHPEQLEFPTETWAAQDIRKAAVFEFAAVYAETTEQRQRLIEKADWFFNYATSTLRGMPTHTLTRPIVVLLSYGFQRPLSSAVGAPMKIGTSHFAAARPFEPYKRRVVRRLAIATVALLGFATVVAWAAL